MSESMLEKMARAIHAARDVMDNDHWDAIALRRARLGMYDLDQSQRDAFREAEAALQAIREPDERMLDAGQQEQGDCFGWERRVAAATFTAMIDAILASPTTEGGK